jgi:hypothetical protein
VVVATETVVGYAAAPLEVGKLYPWITSLRRHRPDVRVVLLCDPLLDYHDLELGPHRVELIEAHLHWDKRDPVSVWRDRWLCVSELDLDGTVLLTDTRDVFFQRDPFPQITDRITVGTEGGTFRVDKWNRDRLELYFPEYAAEMMNAPNICAGVIGGPAKLIRSLARDIWERCKDKPAECDQAALNITIQKQYAGEYVAIPYTQAWVCHCARMLSPWADGPRTEEYPDIMDGMVLSASRRTPFAIVHGWPFSRRLSHFGVVYGDDIGSKPCY